MQPNNAVLQPLCTQRLSEAVAKNQKFVSMLQMYFFSRTSKNPTFAQVIVNKPFTTASQAARAVLQETG